MLDYNANIQKINQVNFLCCFSLVQRKRSSETIPLMEEHDLHEKETNNTMQCSRPEYGHQTYEYELV